MFGSRTKIVAAVAATCALALSACSSSDSSSSSSSSSDATTYKIGINQLVQHPAPTLRPLALRRPLRTLVLRLSGRSKTPTANRPPR